MLLGLRLAVVRMQPEIAGYAFVNLLEYKMAPQWFISQITQVHICVYIHVYIHVLMYVDGLVFTAF